MENHSLIKASRGTHGKIVLLAIAASMVFVVVAAFGAAKSDGARTAGPIVKAKTPVTIARGETAP